MSYPNSDLAMWQLIVIGVVPFLMLAIWLIAVYLADRQPRREQERAAAGSPAKEAAHDVVASPGDRAAA